MMPGKQKRTEQHTTHTLATESPSKYLNDYYMSVNEFDLRAATSPNFSPFKPIQPSPLRLFNSSPGRPSAQRRLFAYPPEGATTSSIPSSSPLLSHHNHGNHNHGNHISSSHPHATSNSGIDHAFPPLFSNTVVQPLYSTHQQHFGSSPLRRQVLPKSPLRHNPHHHAATSPLHLSHHHQLQPQQLQQLQQHHHSLYAKRLRSDDFDEDQDGDALEQENVKHSRLTVDHRLSQHSDFLDDLDGNDPLIQEEKKKEPTTTGGNKGLRHFSTRVSQKVEEKGVTTYNEVAEELVKEMGTEQIMCDHKNIRRRVYDALNVLMAIQIISKEKKQIRWLGLPSGSRQRLHDVKREHQMALSSLQRRQRYLYEMIFQEIAFRNLIAHNRQSVQKLKEIPKHVKLPFILVRANKNAVVNGEVSPDQTHYYITLDSPYDVYDDYQILEKLGLGTTTPAALLKLVPASLYRYLPAYILDHPQSDQYILWEPYDPAFPQNLGEDLSGMNAAHILRAARESSSSHLSSEVEVKEEGGDLSKEDDQPLEQLEKNAGMGLLPVPEIAHE